MATKTQDIEITKNATSTDMVPVNDVPETEETALVPVSPSTWLQQPEFDASDVFLPMLKLGQSTTREVQSGDYKPGEYIVQGYPGMKSPVVVPLSAKKIYRRIATLPGKPVACWNHTTEVDQDCPNCRWQYEKALKDGNFPSTLATTYHYDIYVADLGSPAVLELSGTAGSAAKVLNAKIMGRGLGKLAVRLGSVLTENDKGRWYTPVIQEVTEDPSEILAAALALATA